MLKKGTKQITSKKQAEGKAVTWYHFFHKNSVGNLVTLCIMQVFT
jgi:hypothetical protein